MARRLVILDRDGVINHDSDDFIKSPDEWQPITGSLEAIGRLSSAGFDIAVATNQSGVGRKLLDKPTLESIHNKMRTLVREQGGHIDEVVYCPHHPDDDCDCRKPRTGLLTRLSRQYGQSLDGVPMIGDSLRDIEAARAVGGRPILVMTGNGRSTLKALAEQGIETETYADLDQAVTALLAEAGSA